MIFKNKVLNILFKITILLALYAIANYFGLLAFGISLFIIALIFVFFPRLQEREFRSAEKKLSTTKIAFLKPGIVKIRGICKIIEPAFSKISNTACIAHSYKVERVGLARKISSAKASTTYYTLSYEEFCNPFLIEDETGAIKIKPDGLIINSFYNQKKKREADRQFTEKTILEGESVIIIGEVVKKNGTYVIQHVDSKKPFYLNSEVGLNNFENNKPFRKKIVGYLVGFLVLFSIILVVDKELLEKGIFGFTLNLNILQDYKLGVFWSCIGLLLLLHFLLGKLLNNICGFNHTKKIKNILLGIISFLVIFFIALMIILHVNDVAPQKLIMVVLTMYLYSIAIILNNKSEIFKWSSIESLKKPKSR